MEFSGLRVHILLAGRDILRCPRWWIESERQAPFSMAGLTLADPTGELYRAVKQGDSLEIRGGYRNQTPAIWTGAVAWTRQGRTRDELELAAADPASIIATTLVRQSWENETPEAIVAFAIRKAGLAAGRVGATGMVLPRFVASSIPVWQVAVQAAHSCQKAFDLDMRRWALWQGGDGRVNWGDFDEPGDVAVIATAAGLIRHDPAGGAKGLGTVETFLLPELRHSRLFRLRDVRRGVDQTFRALRVRHEGTPDKARTHLVYGEEHGWA